MPNETISTLIEKYPVSDTDVLPLVDNSSTPNTKKVQRQFLLIKPATKTVIPFGSGGADYYTFGFNDDVQIQAAINSLGSSGGKILLAKGIYYIGTPITISQSNIEIVGMGVSTQFFALNGLNDAVVRITGSGTTNIKLRNFSMQGNAINQTAGHGIYIDTPPSPNDALHLLEDIFINNVNQDGIYTPTTNFSRVIYFNRVRVDKCGGSGFNIGSTDCMFIQCDVANAQKDGFWIQGADNHLTTCKAFSCGKAGSHYAGFHIDNRYNRFTDCEAQDNMQNGWYINNGSNVFCCTFINCSADSNGANVANTGDRYGWYIKDANSIELVACYCRNGDTPAQQTYGIYLDGVATGINVLDAKYAQNTVAPFFDNSTGVNSNIVFTKPILATGASNTVDNIITVLQNLGLVRQS